MKKLSKNNPSVANATAPFTQGSLWTRSCIFRGIGFARSICNTNAKLAIKGDKNVFYKEKENTEILRAKSRE